MKEHNKKMNTQHSLDEKDVLEAQNNLLLFRLGKQLCALPIEPIVRLTEMVTITPLPQLNPAVVGVITVHGVEAPVVDLRRFLGISEARMGLHTPIILVRVERYMIGLIVDELQDVATVTAKQIMQPSDILPHELGRPTALAGLLRLNGRTVMLLDLAHLFAPVQEIFTTHSDLTDFMARHESLHSDHSHEPAHALVMH